MSVRSLIVKSTIEEKIFCGLLSVRSLNRKEFYLLSVATTLGKEIELCIAVSEYTLICQTYSFFKGGSILKPQDYENHTRIVPSFHYFLVPLCFSSLLAGIVFTILSVLNGGAIGTDILITALALIVTITVFFLRSFVCKLQDRIIRAEENLRSFVLTGKMLDNRLTMEQIIALRFAGDEEFPKLCEETVKENLAPDVIKQFIKNWKADHYRV